MLQPLLSLLDSTTQQEEVMVASNVKQVS